MLAQIQAEIDKLRTKITELQPKVQELGSVEWLRLSALYFKLRENVVHRELEMAKMGLNDNVRVAKEELAKIS